MVILPYFDINISPMRRFLAHVIVLLLCFTCLFAQQPSPEDYKVYTALFREEIKGRDNKISNVTIMKELAKKIDDGWIIDMLKEGQQNELVIYTQTPDGTRLREPIDTATCHLIIAFDSTHHKGKLSKEGFHIKEKIEFITRFPIRRKHIEKDWQYYHKTHPGTAGIYTFSNVHYSADGNTAIVYHAVHCHSLCGHGRITVLKKVADNWEMKFALKLWSI